MKTANTLLAFLVFGLMALTMVTSMADDRKVVVSGKGELSVEPDRAVLNFAVEIRKLNQQDAKDEATAAVRRFLKLCDDLDIPEKDVTTTQMYINPEYSWSKKNEERKLTGYLVRRSMEVRLDEISKLGVLMDRATSLGVNQASPPRLEASNREELERQALAKAATNARLNAETVATTLDARVGPVHTIRTTHLMFNPPPVGPRPEMMRSSAMSKSSDAGDTFTVGEIKISAELAVEFDLIVD